MSDNLVAEFLDDWIEQHVAHRFVLQPSNRQLAEIAVRCLEEAERSGIPLVDVEIVVSAIVDQIDADLQLLAAVKKRPS